MIVIWLLYALLVGAPLACAGCLLDAGARLLRLPVRWIWVGVLVALFVVVARGAMRPAAAPPEAHAAVAAALREAASREAASGMAASSGTHVSRATRFGSARAALDAPLRAVMAATQAETRRTVGIAFVACWIAASTALLLLFCATLRRYGRARRAWTACEVDGVRVRVAPRTGPAVVGLFRPDIVLPAWLLDAPLADRRLVLAHEREHVRAHDHVLLAFASLATALLPWHPAVWWVARRLRLAIELDCDARVLKGGARVAAYGSLLVEMAGRCAPLPAPAAALAEAPTHLERRLIAMTRRVPSYAVARGGVLVACASLFVAAACETALPTAVELDAMDVAAVERHADVLGIASDDAPTFFVDGVRVDEATARALPADRIHRLEVVRAALAELRAGEDDAPSRRPTVHITTAEQAEREARVSAAARRAERTARALAQPGSADRDAALSADTLELLVDDGERLLRLRAAAAGSGAATARYDQPTPSVSIRPATDFDGIVLIDGRRVDPRELRRLSPDAIESIEITKGPAAARLFADRAAANGVINIRTKAGAPR